MHIVHECVWTSVVSGNQQLATIDIHVGPCCGDDVFNGNTCLPQKAEVKFNLRIFECKIFQKKPFSYSRPNNTEKGCSDAVTVQVSL